MWPTNLMGQLRIQAQMSYGDSSFIGYGLCFFILTLLTIFFVFTYLKRVLYMAFLTMIAPLVALTYPIDKISDGQAQAFNRWLKEYIFNLLIQPLHLLIYTILITSAFDLAGKNVLYSLAAIGFLIPAEKLMRSFFGFEKASTPGSLAGAAVGAGLINTGLNQLLHRAPPGKGGKNGSNGSDGDDGSAPARIGYKNNDGFNPLDEMAGNNENNGETDNTEAQREMLDAYDENYGTDEWDPAERDQMAREAYKDDGGMQYTDDEYMQILKDSGYTDEEIAQMMGGSDQEEAPEEEPEETEEIEEEQQPTQRINNARGRMTAGDVVRGAGRAIKYTARQGSKNAIKAARRTVGGAIAAAPNAAVRAATGVALGATAGAIGTGVAIASGDPSNLLTYGGGAALAAGSIGASRAGINTSNTKSAAQIAREREFYGDRYDDHVAEKNMKKWKKDDEKRQELERYLGSNEVKNLYKDNKIDNYLKNEITDAKDIAALEKLQKDKNVSFNDALVYYDAHDKYGDITRQKPKDRTDIENGYAKEFTNRGNSQKNAEGKAKRITDMTHEFESIKKNLR